MNAVLVLLHLILCAAIVAFVPPLVEPFVADYMICLAIAGAFVIGMHKLTAASFLRQIVALSLLGVALTYLGVTRSARIQFERYGNLEQVQRSRLDAARRAE
jgi:membrane protein implicated in regulation of membrane protease activity